VEEYPPRGWRNKPKLTEVNSIMKLITGQDFRLSATYRALIHGFDEKQLTPAGYDFRAGFCKNLTTGDETFLEEGRVHLIYHGDFVTIETRESVNLRDRDDIFGLVFSKVSFASRGLSHVGTKIDPGYAGKLRLSFENRGYEVFQVGANTSICNVAFLEIPPTGAEYFPLGADYIPTSIVRTSLKLPFPLKKDESERNRQWFSREVLDAYIQLSEELERFRGEVSHNLDHAERIYNGAILTTFVAAIAVISVLIAAAALFLNQVRAPFNSAWLSFGGMCLAVVVLVYILELLRRTLGKKPQEDGRASIRNSGQR
jgi:deoxycytidine triphosphate deaminase